MHINAVNVVEILAQHNQLSELQTIINNRMQSLINGLRCNYASWSDEQKVAYLKEIGWLQGGRILKLLNPHLSKTQAEEWCKKLAFRKE